ncbi:tetratricopeptide repeat protein [Luteitalea sp.]
MSWWRRLLGQDTGDVDPHGPVRFDTGGWTPHRRATGAREWTDALGNVLRLEIEPDPAPYLTAATDLSALREWCRRNAAQRQGGIVSVDVVEIRGRQGLQIIDKFERQPSYDYEGTLIVPLRDGHCRFVVRACEHGTTGMREAVITGHLVSSGELDLSSVLAPGGAKGGTSIPGWFSDPYDPTYEGRTLRSLADDPRVDGLFPDHPLSQVRVALATLRDSIEFDDVDEAECGPTLTFASAGEDGRSGHEMSPLAVGTLLLEAGRFVDAQTILEKSLKRHVANAGGDPTRVAMEWQILGFAHEAQAHLDEAEAAFEASATGFAASLGQRHLRTAQAINNRARMLITRKDADAAEPLFRFSLEVFESGPSETSDAAVALNGLGLVHIVREQYREAVGCFELAVDIFERVHGPAFPDTATALRNMALAWKRLGDLERMAEAWHRAEDVESASRRRRPA